MGSQLKVAGLTWRSSGCGGSDYSSFRIQAQRYDGLF